MKDPSINVKMSDLVTIIHEIGVTGSLEGDMNLVNQIFAKSQSYKINRNHIVTSKDIKKRIESAARNTTWDIFQGRLIDIRRSRGHKFIRPIDADSKDWSVLMDVSNDAEEFAKTHELDLVRAVDEYIEIGLKLIGRDYRLSKFKYYKSKIFQRYQDILTVKGDQYPQKTKELFEYYCAMVTVDVEFSVHYVYATEQCMENQADIRTWIDAQINGLEFLGAVPEPYQLHGENALVRYQSYTKAVKSDHWSEKLS